LTAPSNWRKDDDPQRCFTVQRHDAYGESSPTPGPAPLQEQVHAFIFQQREAESLIEPKRRVEALDVNAQRLARGRGF
jgi:hypothetical protein